MRAFIALELPSEIQSWLGEIINSLRTRDAKVRWVNPPQIHLTVKFLGDVNQEQVNGILKDLQDSVDQFSSLNLTIGRLGAFPRVNNPRVVWVGVQVSPQLQQVYERIESVAVKQGIQAEERSFAPHLTLGRVKSLDRESQLPIRLKQVNVDERQVVLQHLTLFESTLTPQGPIYRAIKIFDLK